MELWQTIKNNYPELTDSDFGSDGSIVLQDDSDEKGAYIAKWEYSKPIPDGLKLGK
jgi:hypothetical protein